MQVSFLVVLGVGGYRVASGAITVANLVAFILFLFMMIMPLGQAFGAITAVNSALGALGRIQEIIDLPERDRGGCRDPHRPPPLATDAAITFDAVSFEYPEQVVKARTKDEAELADTADDLSLARRSHDRRRSSRRRTRSIASCCAR